MIEFLLGALDVLFHRGEAIVAKLERKKNVLPLEVAELIRAKYFPKKVAKPRVRVLKKAPPVKSSVQPVLSPQTPLPATKGSISQGPVSSLKDNQPEQPLVSTLPSTSAGHSPPLTPRQGPQVRVLKARSNVPSSQLDQQTVQQNTTSPKNPVDSTSQTATAGIRADGIITKSLSNSTFVVRINESHEVLAQPSDKIIKNFIKILLGDRVTVKLHPSDSTKGQIIYRHRN
jgi:translation initiation factor IF-1